MSSSVSPFKRRKFIQDPNHDEEQEGWLVSYADLITLLFVFFAVMLSISSVSKTKLDFLKDQVNKNHEQQGPQSLSKVKVEIENEIKKENLGTKISTEITNDGLKVSFNEQLLFQSGEAVLMGEGSEILKKFCKILSAMNQKYFIAVEGHTDSRKIHTAQFSSNWALSAMRAVTVIHFISANGVDEKRMLVKAFADTQPVSTLPEQEAKNRRVTLLVY